MFRKIRFCPLRFGFSKKMRRFCRFCPLRQKPQYSQFFVLLLTWYNFQTVLNYWFWCFFEITKQTLLKILSPLLLSLTLSIIFFERVIRFLAVSSSFLVNASGVSSAFLFLFFRVFGVLSAIGVFTHFRIFERFHTFL